MKLQPWKRFLARTEGKGMSFYLCQLIVATICCFFSKKYGFIMLRILSNKAAISCLLQFYILKGYKLR